MPTESQLRDIELRARIRQRIDKGHLHVFVPSIIHAGYGSGATCEGCEQAITRDQVQYEVADPSDGIPIKLHLGCHVLWQMECNAPRSASV